MRRFPTVPAVLSLLVVAGAIASAPHMVAAASPAAIADESISSDLFNPEKHMKVSEVRPGMKGYGLSVFKGTKIDRFEVEVLSILRDFNPKYDVILVRLSGANLEHTGSIAGMSGSPVYLKDEQGKERMVGAFAYGWPLMKDPVGGVQPIEYMLNIRESKKKNDNTSGATQPGITSADDSESSTSTPQERIRWDVSDAIMLPGMKSPPAKYPFAGIDSFTPNPRLGADDVDVTRLRPLATPLMTSGLPPKLLEGLTPIFKSYGLVPLQSGGVSSGRANAANDAKLEPGSVMAVPLLTGDVEMTAVGTTTEVIGERVFGFGHPFNNEGPIALPVGAGEINGVIANLMTSFKLGALGTTYGTLYADEAVGVAGKIGKTPPTIPIDINVRYNDGTGDRKYHFESASHPKFTPLLSAMALTSAVTGAHELPEYHTLDYVIDVEFANGEKVHLVNSLVNASMPELFFELGGPMIAAAQNPFEQVSVKRVEGIVNVTPIARDATILWVNAPRLKYRPGETLKAYVTYRRFRQSDAILPIEFELARDLPEGKYQLTVSGWEQYFSDERAAKPFRFSAESTKDVFAVLREMAAIRHDAIYVRLTRQPDGIAIGRTAMPNLPSSRREVLIGAGRSNTTPFVSSTVKVIPAGNLVQGAAQFEVTIDKNARVETGTGKSAGPRHDAPPTATPSTPQSPPKSALPSPSKEPKPDPKPDVPTGDSE
ncbi:MAG: hypothetical protein QOF78_1009 [Phycisphaerales bacterium]|jgi:hypothetical protein|nr:hypothetical protein [Phycisphaerales bacterium]